MKTFIVVQENQDRSGSNISLKMYHANDLEALANVLTDFDELQRDFAEDGEQLEGTAIDYLNGMEESFFIIKELVDGELVPVDIDERK